MMKSDNNNSEFRIQNSELTESRLNGTLVKGIGSFYTVRTEDGTEYTVRCMKKIRREKKTPMVGDRVCFTPGQGEEHGWLEEILPRQTECLRPLVANITMLVIVIAPVPEPDMVLADRQISRALSQGMKVIIVVNKSDLDPGLAEKTRREYAATGIPVFAVSALKKTGLNELREAMAAGGLCCLTGQSGAGKSTMLNVLLDLNLETGSISRRISRGKNTTRHTELIEKNGLKVMDTAGFNLLEAENALEPQKLKERWPEFADYEGKCRFRECLHDREPGCAVTEAAQRGEISEERLNRYRQLLTEAREVWRERYD